MPRRTVKLKKYVDIVNEYDAAGAITPGMLIEVTSADKVQAHSGAGQNAAPMFALEDELQGNDIDDAYAADDKVQCWSPVPGEEVYAILDDGNNVSIGDFLESAGNGNLQTHSPDKDSSARTGDTYSQQVVAVALEAINIADSSGAESSGALGYDKRIKVRIV